MNKKIKFSSGGLYALPLFVIAIGLFVVIWAGIWIKKSQITNHTQKYITLIHDVNNQQVIPDRL